MFDRKPRPSFAPDAFIARADRIMQANRAPLISLRDGLTRVNNPFDCKAQAAACLIMHRANVNLAVEQGRTFRSTHWLDKAAFWRAHAFKMTQVRQ